MGVGVIVNAIERFFLDLIGSVIPGFFLIAGLFYLFDRTSVLVSLKDANGCFVFLLLAVSYAIGHAFLYYGFNLSLGVYGWCKFILTKITRGKIHPVENRKQYSSRLLREAISQEFLQAVVHSGITSRGFIPKKINELRNIALSVEGVDRDIVYRFTFLSLFNLQIAGVALVFAVTLLILQLVSICESSTFLLSTGHLTAFAAGDWIAIALLLLVYVGCINRYYRFDDISIRMPITNALVKLNEKNGKERRLEKCDQGCLPSVYLAGGFQSAWQEKVISRFKESFNYFDPRNHNIKFPRNYTNCDLQSLKACDIVFAYMEDSNPAGYALALEIGYAKALGKIVFFVDEKSQTLGERSRYLDMLKESSDFYSEDIAEGIDLLEKYLNMTNRKTINNS